MPDPYLIPGTNVLRNKLGITDTPTLDQATREFSAARMQSLGESSVSKLSGFARLRGIHQHLFGDVFDWAGRPRTTPLAKRAFEGVQGDVTTFAEPAVIELQARRIFSALEAEDNLKGLPLPLFAARAADYYAQLNDLHPFREGNGRVQRAFFRGLAREAGHDFQLDVVTGERWIAASVEGSRGDIEPFKGLFRDACDPQCRALLRPVVDMMKRHDPIDWNSRSIEVASPGTEHTGLLSRLENAAFLVKGGGLVVFHLDDLPAGAQLEYRNTLTATWAPASFTDRGVHADNADVYRAGGLNAAVAMVPARADTFREIHKKTVVAEKVASTLGLKGAVAARFVAGAEARLLHRLEHGQPLEPIRAPGRSTSPGR